MITMEKITITFIIATAFLLFAPFSWAAPEVVGQSVGKNFLS